MARTHEQVAFDVAITDPSAIVRAVIVDDHELSTVEPSNRNRTCTVTRRNDMAQRDEADLVQLWPPIIRVVAQHIEHFGTDRRHAPTVEGRSDSSPRGVSQVRAILALIGDLHYLGATWRLSWSTSISTAIARTPRR